MAKRVAGGCHCGAVRFAATADFSKAVECNCSICEKKGALLCFIPAENFEMVSGRDALTDYVFNTKAITHRFCSVCGVEAFAQSADGAMINVRCLDGVDLGRVERLAFDGRSL